MFLKKKNLIILIALLSIAAFGFLLFHTHADGGDHTHHCFVCRLVQQLALIFIPIVTFISATLICRAHAFAPVKKLSSFLLTENLQGRAPPVLSSLRGGL